MNIPVFCHVIPYRWMKRYRTENVNRKLLRNVGTYTLIHGDLSSHKTRIFISITVIGPKLAYSEKYSLKLLPKIFGIR
jgi:hypothetical protein